MVGILTRRQVEIIELIARGFANKQIAVELHISNCTVKTHLSGIMERIEASNRAHIVYLFYVMGVR